MIGPVRSGVPIACPICFLETVSRSPLTWLDSHLRGKHREVTVRLRADLRDQLRRRLDWPSWDTRF